MDYTTLGRSGLHVSRACLGAMMFAEAKTGLCNEEDSRRIIDHFIDARRQFHRHRRRLLLARVGVHRRSGDRLAPRPDRAGHQRLLSRGTRAESRRSRPQTSDCGPGGQPAQSGHGLHRPVPVPQHRPGHPDRGDHGHPARLRAVRKGALHRLLELAGLADRRSAMGRRARPTARR